MGEPMQVDHIEEVNHVPQQNDEVINVDLSFDLESYIQNYTGFIKYQRLMFIAKHCPTLRAETLKLAHDYVKHHTFDISAYNIIFKHISAITGTPMTALHAAESSGPANSSITTWLSNIPTTMEGLMTSAASNGVPDSVPMNEAALANNFQVSPSAVPNSACLQHLTYDQSWVENMRRKSTVNLERLDTDLKNYKANSIKESIRRGCDDLGDMFMLTGALNCALKSYSRSRDYCTSYRQELSMCLNVIRVAIYLQNWSHVNTHVSRAETIPDLRDSDVASGSNTQRDFQLSVRTKLHCATGLAELASANFKAAARSFLMASYDHCDYAEILTVSNVAHYGGLCALATFDRGELKSKVLNSVSFKQFLEAEPQIRDIINNFYNSQYTECLLSLDKIKDTLKLDMFLSEHVNYLYREIRCRALCQYFSPYLSADLNKMAHAFNTSVVALENELTALILDGSMNARIDSHGKMLHSRFVDQRCITFERALNLTKEYEQKCKAIILRTALQRKNICVKSNNKEESDTRFPADPSYTILPRQ